MWGLLIKEKSFKEGAKMAYLPYVIEKTGQSEKAYDVFTRLLKDRIIFISGEINDNMADGVIAQLLFLESENSESDINVYINSPGGSVTAGLAIYDTMQYIQCDIRTICMGQCYSMASLLLAGGTKGKRMMLPSSSVMIHQPWGDISGQAVDINIQAKEILRLKDLLIRYYEKHTNRNENSLRVDLERDFYMTPDQAIDYGIADKILTR